MREDRTIKDVSTFQCPDFSSKDELAMDSFGSVYHDQRSNLNNEVVVKVLRGHNRESKRLFLKEARLLHKI